MLQVFLNFLVSFLLLIFNFQWITRLLILTLASHYLMSHLMSLFRRGSSIDHIQIYYLIQQIKLIASQMMKLLPSKIVRLLDIWFDGKKNYQLMIRGQTKVNSNILFPIPWRRMRVLPLLTRWSRVFSNSGSMMWISR